MTNLWNTLLPSEEQDLKVNNPNLPYCLRPYTGVWYLKKEKKKRILVIEYSPQQMPKTSLGPSA